MSNSSEGIVGNLGEIHEQKMLSHSDRSGILFTIFDALDRRCGYGWEGSSISRHGQARYPELDPRGRRDRRRLPFPIQILYLQRHHKRHGRIGRYQVRERDHRAGRREHHSVLAAGYPTQLLRAFGLRPGRPCDTVFRQRRLGRYRHQHHLHELPAGFQLELPRRGRLRGEGERNGCGR